MSQPDGNKNRAVVPVSMTTFRTNIPRSFCCITIKQEILKRIKEIKEMLFASFLG